MSGNTIPQPTKADTAAMPAPSTVAPALAGAPRRPLSQSRAARELGLKRGELDLAVQLGCVRTVLDEGGGDRRVARAEMDRLRAEEGFPEGLRERVATVGTTAAAEILGLTAACFGRIARLGLLAPVTFYLNRYRAVVWLYLAEEVRQFAADEDNATWLKGRIPEESRDRLEAGFDLRPRNWRGRHLGSLLRQADDPWTRAAAPASLLDPVQVAKIVQDPYERAYLNRHRPARFDQGVPDSPASRLTAEIMTADDPDEIAWLRADLQQSLAEARAHRLAPRRRVRPPHLPKHTRRPAKRGPQQTTGPEKRPRVFGWFRRRHL